MMAADTQENAWNARTQLVIGFVALAVLVVGLGGWSALARIAGAVVAPGMIEVEANRQMVNHQDGGVVAEILKDDGDIVEAGDVLLRLDGTLLRSELATVEGQLFEVLARMGRLEAERDELDELPLSQFDPKLIEAAAADPEIRKLIDGQLNLFEARRTTLQRRTEQLSERKVQMAKQIDGTNAQLEALSVQLALIKDEINDVESLLKGGLAQKQRLLALQRQESQLLGRVGELTATVAQSEGRITELDIEIDSQYVTRREEAITTLRDLEYSAIELTQRRSSLLETLSRLEIRAPLSGTVYGNAVHAVRSVIRPAEPVMYIVPKDSPLVITSRIDTIHIDDVQIGQEATLRFSTFNQRTTPELKGHVTNVSADVFQDERTGQTYYEVELLPNDGELQKLEGLVILPGMPVESFIMTAERSPINYLVKPFADYFNRAFRES